MESFRYPCGNETLEVTCYDNSWNYMCNNKTECFSSQDECYCEGNMVIHDRKLLYTNTIRPYTYNEDNKICP